MCNKDKLRFVGQLVLYHKELQTEVAFFFGSGASKWDDHPGG